MSVAMSRRAPWALPADQQAAFIRWAYGLFGRAPCEDDLQREIHVAPFFGCYGLAGYVITVNGSPPRGTVIVQPASAEMVAMCSGALVRGSASVEAPRIHKKRYAEAVEWLARFGLPIPERGW